MASITGQSGSRMMIQFIGTDKRRRSVRLGKAPMSTAQTTVTALLAFDVA